MAPLTHSPNAFRWAAAVLVAATGVGLPACQLPRFRPVTKLVSKAMGESRWFRVEAPVSPLPDPGASGDGEGAGEAEALPPNEAYDKRLNPLWIDEFTPCSALAGFGAPPRAPVYVLVHGIYGDGPEWWPVLPVLDQANPSAMFMFRWSLIGQHRELVESLSAGVLRIAACFPNATPLVLLSHSAGGVIASAAAHGFTVGTKGGGPKLWVLTVASPLAGVGYRGHEAPPEDDSGARLVYELGGSQEGYPAAAPGVAVIHFRTTYPSDKVMKPNVFGHAPNERGVGVAGAREVDLPVELGHVPSLLYVAKELVAGRAP